MNKILILLVFISQTINLFSQPGEKNVFINQAAYLQPFLDCVTDEKDFAKYAVEAHQYGFNLMDHIKCKLHIKILLITLIHLKDIRSIQASIRELLFIRLLQIQVLNLKEWIVHYSAIKI